MERRDWILLALYVASDNQLQPVQLQKSLFLLGERIGDVGTDFYEFVPYHYGPFAKEIYADADALASEGLLSAEKMARSHWREYSATQEGLDRAAALCSDANDEALAYLRRAVTWTQTRSFNEVVRSIYAHFPNYRANSVFQS
jgi:uncharacterized protein (DUF488 family)